MSSGDVTQEVTSCQYEVSHGEENLRLNYLRNIGSILSPRGQECGKLEDQHDQLREGTKNFLQFLHAKIVNPRVEIIVLWVLFSSNQTQLSQTEILLEKNQTKKGYKQN